MSIFVRVGNLDVFCDEAWEAVALARLISDNRDKEFPEEVFQLEPDD